MLAQINAITFGTAAQMRCFKFTDKGALDTYVLEIKHFPALHGHWLACVGPAAGGGGCHKSECPGYPSITHGFTVSDLWTSDYCNREVFQIYACGRSVGSCIYAQDRILLYHVHRGQSLWLALGGPEDMNAGRLPCPGTPPHYRCRNRDGVLLCVWESFTIWKKP